MDVLADSSDRVAEHGGREQNQITGLSAAGDKQPKAWLKREQQRSAETAQWRRSTKWWWQPRGYERWRLRGRLSECCTEGRGRVGADEHSCWLAQEAETGASFTGSAQAAAGSSLVGSGGWRDVSLGRCLQPIYSDNVSYASKTVVK